MALLKAFMNQAASHLTTPGVIQNGRFYRKKAGARELLTKERIIWGLERLLLVGKRIARIFITPDCFPWGMERAYMADYLIDVD